VRLNILSYTFRLKHSIPLIANSAVLFEHEFCGQKEQVKTIPQINCGKFALKNCVKSGRKIFDIVVQLSAIVLGCK